jgi:hypothetical protein
LTSDREDKRSDGDAHGETAVRHDSDSFEEGTTIGREGNATGPRSVKFR